MVQAVNGNGQVRDLFVSTAAGVTTITAKDAESGSRVTRFTMGESQASALRAELPGTDAVTAPAGDAREQVLARNRSGNRDVTVTRDRFGEVTLTARDTCDGLVKVRLTMDENGARNLAAKLQA